MIGVRPARGGKCGGSLINSRFVISAAHCFDKVGPRARSNTIHVYFGRHHRQLKGTKYAVEEVIFHPGRPGKTDATKNDPHDIALLRLTKDAELSSMVSLVCLPSGPQDSPPPGTRALVSGWGRNENDTSSDKLQYNCVHVISLDECKERGVVLSTMMDTDSCVAVRSEG